MENSQNIENISQQKPTNIPPSKIPQRPLKNKNADWFSALILALVLTYFWSQVNGLFTDNYIVKTYPFYPLIISLFSFVPNLLSYPLVLLLGPFLFEFALIVFFPVFFIFWFFIFSFSQSFVGKLLQQRNKFVFRQIVPFSLLLIFVVPLLLIRSNPEKLLSECLSGKFMYVYQGSTLINEPFRCSIDILEEKIKSGVLADDLINFCMEQSDKKITFSDQRESETTKPPIPVSYQEYCIYVMGRNFLFPSRSSEKNDFSNNFYDTFMSGAPKLTLQYLKDSKLPLQATRPYQDTLCKVYGQRSKSTEKENRCLSLFENNRWISEAREYTSAELSQSLRLPIREKLEAASTTQNIVFKEVFFEEKDLPRPIRALKEYFERDEPFGLRKRSSSLRGRLGRTEEVFLSTGKFLSESLGYRVEIIGQTTTTLQFGGGEREIKWYYYVDDTGFESVN